MLLSMELFCQQWDFIEGLPKTPRPENLGARLGFIGVLHTWGQNLMAHPHIHFITTGGGLNKNNEEWISCKENFLLPVKILSEVFRGKFLDYLKKAFLKDELVFLGENEDLANHINFELFLEKTRNTKWVVYSKKPFAGPRQVIEYLGQYTHRIAISNYRLIKLEDNKVHFKYQRFPVFNNILSS